MYFVLLFILHCCVALDLPDFFPKCCMNDPLINDCLLNAAMKVKPFIKDGVNELEIPSLFRVITPNFIIHHKTENAHFVNTLKNFTFYGMDDYQIEDLKFEPRKISLQGKFMFKELFQHAYYKIKEGTILEVPITGDGIFGGIIGPLNVTFTLRGSLEEKNQVEYAKVDECIIVIDIKQYDIGFQGLTYENGAWGNTNKLFRENTKLVGQTLTPAFQEMFQIFVTDYLKWFLNEIPYNKLFPCS
ncbi:hypothetical protein FQR65_LT02604 [Abscondita terminalis]|nr:hypothetical protein FQR65_LT02604 [Abscondita terminalis]